MKSTFRIIIVVLSVLLPVIAESAVVVPSHGGVRATATRSFRASRSFNGVPSTRSFNSRVNTTVNNGSPGVTMARSVNGVPTFNVNGLATPQQTSSVDTTVTRSVNGPINSSQVNTTSSNNNGLTGLTLARPVNGVPTFNVNGLAPPPQSTSVDTSVSRSFNGPFGSGSSDSMFNSTFQGDGMGSFNTNGTLGPFGGSGLINQAVDGSAVPFNSTPNLTNAAAFSPAAFDGGIGDDGSDGGPPETPASTALKGEASVTNATGQYNQATSAAAVKATEAESRAMNNAMEKVHAYYAARDAGRNARDNERGKAPDAAEIARRARGRTSHFDH